MPGEDEIDTQRNRRGGSMKKLPTLRIDSQSQPKSADGEWMYTELSNQIFRQGASRMQKRGKRKKRKDWEAQRGVRELRWKHAEWKENKKSRIAAICSRLRLHLFQYIFNHPITLAIFNWQVWLCTNWILFTLKWKLKHRNEWSHNKKRLRTQSGLLWRH